jgi:hypothetical protein
VGDLGDFCDGQAPFEIILAINPIVEMIGTPLMTGLLLPLGQLLSN